MFLFLLKKKVSLKIADVGFLQYDGYTAETMAWLANPDDRILCQIHWDTAFRKIKHWILLQFKYDGFYDFKGESNNILNSLLKNAFNSTITCQY